MRPDPWESAESSVGGCVSSGNTVKLAVHMVLILYPYRMRLRSCFLQLVFEKRTGPFTLKVYATTILALHVGLNNQMVGFRGPPTLSHCNKQK